MLDRKRIMFWYCIYTQPQAELKVQKILEMRHGFDTFLPLLVQRVGGKLNHERLRPLFSRYVFVRFSAVHHNWRAIWSIEGVKYLFSADPQNPTKIPQDMIDAINHHVPQINQRTKIPHPGDEIKFTTGPFKDLVGICQESSDTRGKILLSIFGRLTETGYRNSDIEIVND